MQIGLTEIFDFKLKIVCTCGFGFGGKVIGGLKSKKP